MTTYTITEAPRQQLLDALERIRFAFAPLAKDATLANLIDEAEAAQVMLQSLAPVVAPSASPVGKVFLVATGLIVDGRETYTRHDLCPPLCESETLYTTPLTTPSASTSADGSPIDAYRYLLRIGADEVTRLESKVVGLEKALRWKAELGAPSISPEIAALQQSENELTAQANKQHIKIRKLNDELDALKAAPSTSPHMKELQARFDSLKKMVDDGGIEGRTYSAGLELEKENSSLRAELATLKATPSTRAVYIRRDQLQKAQIAPYMCEVGPEPREDRMPLYAIPVATPSASLPIENIPGLASDESAFIRWAEKEKYDTSSHPMFFVMVDEKTNAARMGWKAAMAHCKAQLAAPSASPAMKNAEILQGCKEIGIADSIGYMEVFELGVKYAERHHKIKGGA